MSDDQFFITYTTIAVIGIATAYFIGGLFL